VHPQDDVIINQDLGVLVSTQNPSDSTTGILNFKNGKKMKYPSVLTQIKRIRSDMFYARIYVLIWQFHVHKDL